MTFDEELTRRAKALATEFHLKESGGSDFHGENKPDIQIGIGRLQEIWTNIPLHKNRENAVMTPFAASFLLFANCKKM